MFQYLKFLSDGLVYNVFNLSADSRLGSSLSFFIYDAIEILILLLLVNYLMAIIHYFLPLEKLRNFLASKKWYGLDYFLAAMFGTITPFCSCSSIPLFIGFLEAGIPLGPTLSFLITSPLVNEVAFVLFISLFGWKIALLYVLSAVMLGVFGGIILDKLNLQKDVITSVWQGGVKKTNIREKKALSELALIFWNNAWLITKKIIPYVLFGLVIGAAIHGYVPANFFEKYISQNNILSVPIAVILAVPMYANSISVIPILQSLVEKGIPLGTALAFMMAVVGLSLPEAMILKRVMKTRLLAYFFGITAFCMIIIGFLFNFLVN